MKYEEKGDSVGARRNEYPPEVRRIASDAEKTQISKLQTAEDLQGDALLHYDAEMELMNLILLSIPNDIYNSVDA
ncbi:hypothetical protein Tco_1192063 [Tanacetum coccineum]